MIEIIGTTVEDALTIEACGGDRIEFISALSEGGLTPSFGLIEKVVNSVNIPVNVIIRPHSKNFTYSRYDIDTMKKDIEIVKDLGANGVVLGVLNDSLDIDEVYLKELLESANGLDITFHKAIDETKPINSVKILNNYPQITNILTSGGKGRIDNNIEIINKMCKEASDIKILLGGGLNFNNIESIRKNVPNCDFHFGTAVRRNNSPFETIDEYKLNKLVSLFK